MKKFICILLALLPLFAVAKDDKNRKEDNYNPKYLVGAVTLTDGKVMFSQSYDVPSLSKAEIYQNLLNWARKRFQPEGKLHSRVVYTNEAEGQIAVMGEEYIVFSSSALSLDRTRIYYQLSLYVSEGKFSIEMSRIRFWYDENRDGGEKYTAEEWIIDEMALTKKNTKLAPICGKFRRGTINLKDQLFKDAAVAVSLSETETQVQTNATATSTVEKQIVVSPTSTQTTTIQENTQTSVSAQYTNESEKAAAPVSNQVVNTKKELSEIGLNELPANLSDIATTGRMTITAGEEEIEVKPEAWGGFGKLLNNDVTYTLIDKSRIAISLIMEHSDTYKISFYKAGSTEPLVVIDCKKTMKQELTSAELKALNQQINSNKQYVMYIGAVTRCMKQK